MPPTSAGRTAGNFARNLKNPTGNTRRAAKNPSLLPDDRGKKLVGSDAGVAPRFEINSPHVACFVVFSHERHRRKEFIRPVNFWGHEFLTRFNSPIASAGRRAAVRAPGGSRKPFLAIDFPCSEDFAMRLRHHRLLRSGILMLGVAIVLSGVPRSVQAASIYLDVPDTQLNIPSLKPQVTARDRLARAGSVDQLLFKQPNPAGYPAADLVQLNNTNIGSVTYDFTLKHTAPTDSSGSKFAFSLTDGTVEEGVTFRNANSNNSSISYTFGTDAATSLLNYNILHVFALASTAGTSATFSDMAFTAGLGLSTVGSLETSGSVAAGSGTNQYDQWLAAPTGVNLDLFDWEFTAKVKLAANGTRPSDEGIKFEFTAKQGEFTPPSPVPEPSTLALAVLAIPGLLTLRRIRSK